MALELTFRDGARFRPEDPEWLGGVLGRRVRRVEKELMTKNVDAGYTLMARLHVEYEGGDKTSIVSKSVNPAKAEEGKHLKLFREALFYAYLSSPSATEAMKALDVPRIYFARGEPETALSALLLEDLSAGVQAGYFFGPHQPLNWGTDLAEVCKGWNLPAREVAGMIFGAGCKLHASFWAQEDLMGYDWLRGAAWLKGEGEAEWQSCQKQGADAWAKAKGDMAGGASGVQWSAAVVACVDAAQAKVDWGVFQSELKKRPWTVVHGDFHPANMMMMKSGETQEASVVMIDFEQIGLGSGPQDLGQCLISHCAPGERADIERGAVEEYHRQLCAASEAAAQEMTLEQCWSEYVQGGLGRWMWMLPILCTCCPPKMVQYFHDQVAAFIATHGIDAASAPMPRV